MIKSRYSKVESLKIMGSAPNQALGPNIEILVWNVFKCRKKGWLKDFTTLIHDKNLVILQEAILNSSFDNLFNASSEHQWIMASSFMSVKTSIETGVKTGSTVAAVEHYFSASAHGEPITKTKKMLLATVYPLDHLKQSLLVINVHAINFVSFEKFKAHMDQISLTLEHHNGPILLAGDFNTWNGKRLKYFNELATSFLLEEVEMTRQPRLNHLFQHLDHIYCRGLETVDAHVHTQIHSSDHYPISLSLRTLSPADIKQP
ncbi:endonuclease/exonuclease/phosphatase family protein [Marinomonas primoryensis]|uniref:Endonuclease/exonuclease/phosphatase family protein n=1 Tax=Marinomonas primoryensis TaxID=178399 RepID=A0A859CY45_9GAMM|nr:endonuclease/exonuclease/phosphatase family protein [Marinomonas primoryensis]QKK81603.1 endonuclease/exonuclease/phosphatase family protein [Marinomonas primoryensis]